MNEIIENETLTHVPLTVVSIQRLFRILDEIQSSFLLFQIRKNDTIGVFHSR